MKETKAKILIADDEPDIIEFLQYNLSKGGYEVFTATNGREALALAMKETPDLILLDIMMPEVDGVEVCRELREKPDFSNTVIAFLTARSEDYSQIAGFEVGADDYITKPIKPRVLTARIGALLKRRTETPQESNKLTAGNLTIDKEKHQILIDDQNFHLPKKEYEILELLATKPGKVFSREEIYNLVWGFGVFVGDRTIDVHIRKIREKIGNEYIKTIKGIGYKFAD